MPITTSRLTEVGVVSFEVKLGRVAVVGAAAVSAAGLMVVAAPDPVGAAAGVTAALAGVSNPLAGAVVRVVGAASGGALVKLPVDQPRSAGDAGPPAAVTAGCWAATVGGGWGGRSRGVVG